MKDNLWVWIRVPLSALERAISALKITAMHWHDIDKRKEADEDDAAAESIKKALREDHDDGERH